VILPDAAATEAVGARLASLVTGGDAIALVGELGAGKTTLVAGLVAALGGGEAHSPTFSLVHEYRGGRLIVWHVDLYRIERAAELPELGLDDVVGDPRARAASHRRRPRARRHRHRSPRDRAGERDRVGAVRTRARRG